MSVLSCYYLRKVQRKDKETSISFVMEGLLVVLVTLGNEPPKNAVNTPHVMADVSSYSLHLCFVLGCLLAVEAIPLHFTFFSKLWMEVYQKAGDVCKRLLFCTGYPRIQLVWLSCADTNCFFVECQIQELPSAALSTARVPRGQFQLRCF